MAYSPGAMPDDTPANLKAWLANELRTISAELQKQPRAVPRTTAPNNPREGQIAYASGAWAVTLGAPGLYGYESATWVKL